MSTIPASAFASELEELDYEEFKAFVADLWSRAGWETSLTEDVVVARNGDRTRRLLVAPAGRVTRFRWSPPADDEFDTVVVPQILEDGSRPRWVPSGDIADATDLRHRLVYACDSEDAEALCTSYFGVPFRGSEWEQTERPWNTLQVGQTALAVVLVAGAIGVLVFGLPFVGGDPTTVEAVPPTIEGGVDTEITQPLSEDTVTEPENVPTGETVYGGTTDGTLFALDSSSGERIWRQNVGERVGSPLVVDGVAYASTADGILAVDALTGERLWRYTNVSVLSLPRPTVVDGTLYVGDGLNVKALDTRNGTVRWNRSLSAPVQPSPTVYNGTVYAQSPSGVVYALDADSGETQWRASKSVASFSDTALVIPNAHGTADAERILAAIDDALFGFEVRTGDTDWVYESRTPGPLSDPVVVNATTSLAVPGDVARGASTNTTAYLTDVRTYAYAVDPETGDELWVYEKAGAELQYPVMGGPVSNQTAHSLYVVTDSPVAEYESALLAINGTTGEEWLEFPDQNDTLGPPTASNETVYTGTRDGHVVAVDTGNATERWRSQEMESAVASAVTVVADPMRGNSIDSRVRLGLDGHHDWLTANQTTESRWDDVSVLNVTVTERVAVGEQLSVELTLGNRGRGVGERPLRVDLDGQQQFETTVNLDPGDVERRRISLPAPDGTGEYTVEIRVGNETEARSLTVVERPEHVIRALDDPGQVFRDDEAEIIASIRNPGDVPATTPVVFEFNGETIETRQETVGANETIPVTFSFAPENLPPGNYTYAVGTASDVNTSTLEVRELSRRADAIPVVTQVFGLTLLLSGLALAWRVVSDVWGVELGRVRRELNR